HTRWPRDWSSDVCSSDLLEIRTRENFRPQSVTLIISSERSRGIRRESLKVTDRNPSTPLHCARDDDHFFSQSLFSRESLAASTSAACLLRPVPRPRTIPSQRASTTKVLACSGPVAE